MEPVVVCGSIDTFTVLELDPELTMIPSGTVQLYAVASAIALTERIMFCCPKQATPGSRFLIGGFAIGSKNVTITTFWSGLAQPFSPSASSLKVTEPFVFSLAPNLYVALKVWPPDIKLPSTPPDQFRFETLV